MDKSHSNTNQFNANNFRQNNNQCSPLKKQADALNKEFKELIEDLDDKISSLPKPNDLNQRDAADANFDVKYNNSGEDIHTLKDRLNLSEKGAALFRKDVANLTSDGKIQQSGDVKENEQNTCIGENQSHYANWYNRGNAYHRGRIHPSNVSNLGRAVKDDDYIRTSRWINKQSSKQEGTTLKNESSLSDTETLGGPKFKFCHRKSIRDLAESWCNASSINNEMAGVGTKLCELHICGKQGCRYHKNCALHQSAFPDVPVQNNEVFKQPPGPVYKAKFIKPKERRALGGRCAC